ncbi:hypothetical protein SPI_07775 [Niveomyces insectorum RCEF 264]|uniref:Uncharacterized protein n=1 Tax=Niveomyces insectorum RCEF 264 TaxID=1081102 RepID=A0A167P0W8_9HYPO|nr:hypothetical protein SPI_07775 [Niveomyces insectorum RCEF 264]
MTEPPGKPARRRFAPVPIETTFERYRKGGPAAEPTPSPSPRSASPPPRLWVNEKPKEKKRFAPQLIESSRRSRRTGDVGPATKPTDKTDITPYHNHIYAPQTRKRHRKVQSLARRESCDDETAGHVFEMLAREAEKRLLEEVALAAFPNSGARAGGAEHFAIRESSDDDSSGAQSRELTGPRTLRTTRRSRRDSLTEDVGWALREMQEHHDRLLKARKTSVISSISPFLAARTDSAGPGAAFGDASKDYADSPSAAAAPKRSHGDRVSTFDLDRMSIDSPPNDLLWTTTARQSTKDSAIQPIGETLMPFIPEEPFNFPGASDGYRGIPAYARNLREIEGDIDEEGEEDEELRTGKEEGRGLPGAHPIGELPMPYIPTAPEGKAAVMAYDAPGSVAASVPPEHGFRGRNVYAGYRNRDLFATERDVNRLRRKSPPMLGKDLVFPQYQSPKQTKLEPEFLWSINNCMDGSRCDTDGQHGLWHGFCFASEKNQAMEPIDRPVMLATPAPLNSPGDPFAQAFGKSDSCTIYEEPMRLATAAATTAAATQTPGRNAVHLHSGPQAWPKERHLLASLDERLLQEKAAAERDEKIAAEFTDRFVTQVYNYLSLGYPAMARAYDEELSKISRISVDDLEQDDKSAVEGVGSTAKGHLSLGDEEEEDEAQSAGTHTANTNGHDNGDDPNEAANKKATSTRSDNHDDCPRWRALKLYIFEWARQHPDLDSISPLAWGMRERRGSWGV